MAVRTSQPLEVPVPHRWTLHEYHRAIEAGVFGDARVELLDGELVEMPPMNEPHIGAVGYLAGVFYRQLDWERTLSQTPIVLPNDGEPEPDVAVRETGAPLKPSIEQVQLITDVAQAPRQRDLGSKLVEYLRAGAYELWIIDLVEQCGLVYRNGQLIARHARGSGAKLVAERAPEVTVDLDEVFAAAGLR